MGHEVQFLKFDKDTTRNEIDARANGLSIRYSDNRGELANLIRFFDHKIYKDLDEAHDAISEKDNGWYDQLAVKYYSYEKVNETKTITNLKNRINQKEKELCEYKDKNSVTNRKSTYIGCPNCGSKLKREHMDKFRYNTCPLCGSDLSSNTVKKSIINKKENISKMRKKLAKDIKANNQKGKKTVKWLVKIEYHI